MKTSVFLAFLFLLLTILIMLSGCKKPSEDTFVSDSVQSYTEDSSIINDVAPENKVSSVKDDVSEPDTGKSSITQSAGTESKENVGADNAEPTDSSSSSSGSGSSSQAVNTTPNIPGVSSVTEKPETDEVPETPNSSEVSSVVSSEQGMTTEKPDHVYDNAIV